MSNKKFNYKNFEKKLKNKKFEKKIGKTFWRTSWEKNLGKNLRARNVAITRKSGGKSFTFFYFGRATQNKALNMMGLVSKILFFIKEFMV